MRKTMALLCVAWLWAASALGQVAVIAHKNVPVDTLSKAQLFDFYTYEARFWNKDLPVVVIDLKPQMPSKALFYEFLGISASRMKSLWLKKMLLGEGDPPAAMRSDEEMLKEIAGTPGALGFVSANLVTKQVKILLLIPANSSASSAAHE